MDSKIVSNGSAEFDVPPFALHFVFGVLLAAVAAGPTAAGIVLAINAWRMGTRSEAWMIIAGSLVTTVAVITLRFFLSEDAYIGIEHLVPMRLAAIGAVARALQGKRILRHAERFGRSGRAAPGRRSPRVH